MSNYRRLFCSKLVRQAFDRASLGQFMLPTFHTRFVQNRDFYKRLGVKARETFAPGDMDIEPHFDLVAEWQDYRVTSRLRMQDMLMTKLFEWMEHRDWRFKEDWTIRTISLLGRFSTHLSEDARALVGSVVPKIPPTCAGGQLPPSPCFTRQPSLCSPPWKSWSEQASAIADAPCTRARS